MSLNTFFLSDQILAKVESEEFELELDADDLHHMHVLRLEPGEHVAIVDADSDYFECEIETLDRDRVVVRISNRLGSDGDAADSIPSVTLFQGMPKSDKFETAIKQGTEIGVDGFVPFISERSVSRPDDSKANKKVSRWEKIAKGAAMQSGRRSIPKISRLETFDDAVDDLVSFDRVIIFWEECSQSATLEEALLSGDSGEALQNVAVVIGPEGGFSAQEIDRFINEIDGARVCTLGSTILRTETAAVVGCALVLYELGGLGGIRRTL